LTLFAGAEAEEEESWLIGVPQCIQNFAPGFDREAPHSTQNFEVVELVGPRELRTEATVKL
jgi:hypothetical protein